jgi:acetyl esterase/lipase
MSSHEFADYLPQSVLIAGGGYSVPSRPDYFLFLRTLQKDLSTSLGDVGVAFLEYCELSESRVHCSTQLPDNFSFGILALTPYSPYPTQLRQANAALSHLLKKGISPANIVIGGDSAGGNLALQLASHILHPLPSIPPPPALPQALAGVLMISPWNSYSVDSPAHSRNDRKDVIPRSAYAFFAKYVTPGLTPELKHHCEPLSAPAEWWKGLDGVYARILITAGEHECLVDHILEIASTISPHVKDTATRVEPGATHEEAVLKFGSGNGGVGRDYEAMVEFLSRSFQGAS